ncbi:ABC transporter substrate-binding protein [Bradyrhizobium elkanii]|uniref:ABC transporter substrate-binding protein n=1 Tax=Bradyrhizobium elkanii TaxID=29448 RepID=UPI0018AD5F45|nr:MULTISPECIES: ABC transporter substrate-binding protein [Bradyrhizobium]MCS3451212.1 branched-chain amino acid transport system substrate-binding protein [Bradyrhizobium elkanii]MCS3566765.1 branched-chain amino acid transport system substrate-binding protein [Bradyrhizobium elkanii]MCW2152511.1 branched-chain amino acid transport system substrate-binding protein [Bradyrhizobium elkanii]MCW2357612.1 branched-chain amino acid transport system substrate-binding protein [Bradyrhizobium elkanii]
MQSTTGGSAALYGTEQKQAIELAFSEINAAKTLKDIKLETIYADDGADRGQTVNIFQRLIRQDKVVAILGPTLSNSAFAADPIAQQAGVPVIASSNTAPNLTRIGDFIFRTSVPEDQVFPTVLRFAVKKHGIKRVALIYGLDDALTRGAHDVQKKAVADLGLESVGIESYQRGDVDFSAQLTKIRAQNPDAIILGTLAEEAAAILRQARQLGFDSKVAFIGCNANISAKLFELAGPAANGIIVGAAWYAGYDSLRSKAFVEAYRKRYGTTPDIYAAQGYDAAYLLAEAIRRADDVANGRLIRDKLASINDFEGVLGRFGWSAERDATVQPKVLIGDGDAKVFVAAAAT